MSRKKTEQGRAEREAERELEEALDKIVSAMISSPGAVESLLQNKFFVQEAFHETKKARSDETDVVQLSQKYGVSVAEVESGLDSTGQDLLSLLGDVDQ